MEFAPTRRITVRIEHADPLLSLGLSEALLNQPDVEVLDARSERHADVLLTDLPSALRSGRASAGQAAPNPAPRVMVLTHSDREGDLRLALERGVHGYLLSGCPLDDLTCGVRTLARGQRFISASVACRLADSMCQEPLTLREEQVLQLLSRGLCNKAIARELAIAVGTVKAHMKAIFEKLGATCRTQAANIATQRGLLSSTPAYARTSAVSQAA